MKNLFLVLQTGISFSSYALDPNHFTINKRTTTFTIDRIFPSPFNSELNIQLAANKEKNIFLGLADEQGIVTYTSKRKCSTSFNLLHLDGLGGHQPGIYMLRIIAATASLQQPLLKF